MGNHEIGHIVWLHGKGWDTHPLLVLDIIGDYEHIKVMSMKNSKYIWHFTPQSLHTQPQETTCFSKDAL
jgi:hypothetical protein